jgi:hypothetical protein
MQLQIDTINKTSNQIIFNESMLNRFFIVLFT